ncbi:hypothetical protein [Proteus sp. G2663]|uniref:hypothetical protein n=1 Tax=Proteus sp. G2663 TaxID=2698876 RepID=UPI001376A935|nr:hypothetical protein [Proteus sp. G2663]NBM68727.1 hypothetical protein [Proteus sp. G2663]
MSENNKDESAKNTFKIGEKIPTMEKNIDQLGELIHKSAQSISQLSAQAIINVHVIELLIKQVLSPENREAVYNNILDSIERDPEGDKFGFEKDMIEYLNRLFNK